MTEEELHAEYNSEEFAKLTPEVLPAQDSEDTVTITVDASAAPSEDVVEAPSAAPSEDVVEEPRTKQRDLRRRNARHK